MDLIMDALLPSIERAVTAAADLSNRANLSSSSSNSSSSSSSTSGSGTIRGSATNVKYSGTGTIPIPNAQRGRAGSFGQNPNPTPIHNPSKAVVSGGIDDSSAHGPIRERYTDILRHMASLRVLGVGLGRMVRTCLARRKKLPTLCLEITVSIH